MAVKKFEIYKCSICGNVCEVIYAGGGQLVCCGQNMEKVSENTSDGAREKHVPVAELHDHSTHVQVGSIPHPMESDHYIEWIEIINGDYRNRKYLKPGEAPEADFYVALRSGMTVREYCNKHGLWKA